MPPDLERNLRNRHFLTLGDFEPAEIGYLVDLARRLKQEKRRGAESPRLRGRNIALIFEKLSTRTRCAFEVAAYDQGANVTYIGSTGSHIGSKETIKDTARVLGRMYDGIEYRGHGQAIVEELAAHAGVPVWNGLTDQSHPTQVLADFLTMSEHAGRPLADIKFCFIGDTGNNTGCSLLVGGAKMGMDVRLAGPRPCWPAEDYVGEARSIAQATGARITVTESVEAAVAGCDFLYTDVWVSLGEAESIWGERVRLLSPYQVTRAVMAATGNPDAKFMHCLPAFHNAETDTGRRIQQEYGLDAMEVTDEVFESPASVVFDQAENRVHSIKALLVATLADG